MTDDNDNETRIPRFVPPLVVLAAVGGFVWLAYYAYNTGARSLSEDNLLVIEADAIPMKEKPVDPGGMKFPNQDKTVFETFANSDTPPRVERLLPAPEEPVAEVIEQKESADWVNDKIVQQADTAPQEMETREVVTGLVTAVEAKEPVVAEAKETVAASKPKIIRVAPEKEIAVAEVKTEVKTEVKKVEEVAEEKLTEETVKKLADMKPAAVPSSSAMAQLGAWRSQEQALDGFDNLKKQHAELASKTPIIQKADLGEKGVFYRLRVGEFASKDQAIAFCSKLKDKGSACNPI